MNDLGFKNESAQDKIERLEKELNKIDNNNNELNLTINKDNLDVKDRSNKIDYELKEAV